MTAESSILFFDRQFRRQVAAGELRLNPFEQLALPYLHGRVLDFGCGLGNLAVAAARQGCSVVALDASPAAIAHLRERARAEALPIDAGEADLRTHVLHGDFDAIASIGLLMFFDCAAAHAQLSALQAHVRPGGIAAINVLVEGTTYLDMFDPSGHCLFGPDELRARFAGWEVLEWRREDFPAPEGTVKAFATIVARKPGAAEGAAQR